MHTVQQLFNLSREEWLNKARHEAERIALEHGRVTIENVLAVCPRPQYLSRSVTGQVFRSPVFKVVGFTKSKRPISRSRIICEWGVREEYYPSSWLKYRRRHVEEYGA